MDVEGQAERAPVEGLAPGRGTRRLAPATQSRRLRQPAVVVAHDLDDIIRTIALYSDTEPTV